MQMRCIANFAAGIWGIIDIPFFSQTAITTFAAEIKNVSEMLVDNTFTIITGASMGIGRCLALECASRGMNVLLVALEENLLAELAQTIRQQYGVEADFKPADLTQPADIRAVYDWCIERHYKVNMLLSNAGIGSGGIYENNPLEKYRTLVLLNNMAAVQLTHHFLPMLKQNGPAWLMYTSSMEATIPIPFKAVYTASKHFLYGFSLALKEELRDFGVSVSVLCPGPVATNEGSIARLKTQGKIAQLAVLTPEAVASHAIKGLLAGRRVIVPGALPSLLEKLALCIPRNLKMKLLKRVFGKYKEVQQ